MWVIVLWTLIGLIFLVKALDVRNLYIRWRQMPLALMVASALGLFYLGTHSYSKSGTNTQGAASSEGSVSEPPTQNPESRTFLMPAWWVHDETDTDGDGIPDLWEKWTHGNPLVADSYLDRDGDGLTDLEEFWNQTDPRTSDTDGDGFSDGFEVVYGMNPLIPEDFTPIEPDLNNNDIIDIWEGAGYFYGFEDSNGDGFDDTYAQSGLPDVSDSNFDIVVEVYTTRSAVLTWENGAASDGIVILPTISTSVRLRLPFGADTKLKLLPAPEGIDLPSEELWKSRIRIVFDGRAGQTLSGNALVSPSGMIAHKVVNMESVITRFPVSSPDGGFQPQALGGEDAEDPNADFKCVEFEVFHCDQYHDVGDTVGPFTIINSVGEASATYTWYSKYGDMDPATGRKSWLTVRKVPSHPNEKVIVVTTAELDTQTGVSVEREVERCPQAAFSATFSTQNFSPHLGETLSIDVTVPGCGHIYEPGWLEIEIMRETTAGWQHVASVDMDGSTSTGDRYRDTLMLGGQTLSFKWDGIAQASLPLADHPDVFSTAKGTINRAMPAVVSGEPVPPPFYTLVVRLWDGDKSTVLNELSHHVYIPQVVQISSFPGVASVLATPLVFTNADSSDTVVYAGTENEAAAKQILLDMPQYIMEFMSDDVNIRFVNEEQSVSGAYTVLFLTPTPSPINDGLGVCLGLDQRNSTPTGVGVVYAYNTRETIREYYRYRDVFGDVFTVPLSGPSFANLLAVVSVHEIGHALGLVDPDVLDAYSIKDPHNRNGTGLNIMDSCVMQRISDVLSPSKTRYWKRKNRYYMEFCLPKEKWGFL